MRGISEERLTQEYVKELINYDPCTGLVTWKVSRGKARAGSLASDVSVGSTGKRYGRITIHKKRYKLHRIIWLYVYGSFPETIDHINGNSLDNRITNLRNVDLRTNSLNRRVQNNSTSGIHGVNWHKTQRSWQVSIHDRNGYKYLGKFNNLFDAACVRKSAERIHGYHTNHGSSYQELPKDPE